MKALDLEAIDLDMAIDMLERLSQKNLEAAQEHIKVLLKNKFGKENKQ